MKSYNRFWRASNAKPDSSDYFHSMDIPLFVLNVFAKNEKINISQAERNELKKLSGMLVKQYSIRGKTHERKKDR